MSPWLRKHFFSVFRYSWPSFPQTSIFYCHSWPFFPLKSHFISPPPPTTTAILYCHSWTSFPLKSHFLLSFLTIFPPQKPFSVVIPKHLSPLKSHFVLSFLTIFFPQQPFWASPPNRFPILPTLPAPFQVSVYTNNNSSTQRSKCTVHCRVQSNIYCNTLAAYDPSE